MVVVINKIEHVSSSSSRQRAQTVVRRRRAVDQTSSGILKHQGVFQMLSSQQQPLAKHEFFFMPESRSQYVDQPAQHDT